MIPWNEYTTLFPERYIVQGYFDTFLNDIIRRIKPSIALDVGGGATGTQALKENNIKTDILDPYVDKPKWVRENISWRTKHRYPLIVARGSLNYLTIKQLRTLKLFLAPRGIFLANTFADPPSEEWTKRRFKNSKKQGWEWCRYSNFKVQHQLHFDDGRIYKHEFFYYNSKTLQSVFEDERTFYFKYNKNSLILLHLQTYEKEINKKYKTEVKNES